MTKMFNSTFFLFLIVSVIFGYMQYKITTNEHKIQHLNTVIKKKDMVIDNYRLKYERSIVVITNKENYTNILEDKYNKLLQQLNNTNETLVALKDKTKQLNLEIKNLNKFKNLATKYKHRFLSIVNNVDYNKANCKEGLELNKNIAKLKYKDL